MGGFNCSYFTNLFRPQAASPIKMVPRRTIVPGSKALAPIIAQDFRDPPEGDGIKK